MLSVSRLKDTIIIFYSTSLITKNNNSVPTFGIIFTCYINRTHNFILTGCTLTEKKEFLDSWEKEGFFFFCFTGENKKWKEKGKILKKCFDKALFNMKCFK